MLKNTEALTIDDLFGNTIKVSNLDEAINQAKGGSRVTNTYLTPFELINGRRVEIISRMKELIPVGDYWKDSYKKLNKLKAQLLWKQLGNIPLEEESDNIDEPFLHFESGTNRFDIWSWLEEEFDVSIGKDFKLN